MECFMTIFPGWGEMMKTTTTQHTGRMRDELNPFCHFSDSWEL